MRTLGSTPDPYWWKLRNNVAGSSEPVNLDIYTQVETALDESENTGIFLIYGQSNAANFVNATYTVTEDRSHMFNPINGAMYKTKEPVVGCNGGVYGWLSSPGNRYGNWTARLGDLLIGSGTFDRVIICNVCAGGTYSGQWAAGGDCNNRLVVAAKRLLANGLTPTMVLRHQGENDSGTGISAETYKEHVWSEVDTLRSAGITAPVMVAKVSWVDTSHTSDDNVRQGQADAVDTDRNIILGPDTDALGSSYRQSDYLPHWTASGAAAVAGLFHDAIVSAL